MESTSEFQPQDATAPTPEHEAPRGSWNQPTPRAPGRQELYLLQTRRTSPSRWHKAFWPHWPHKRTPLKTPRPGGKGLRLKLCPHHWPLLVNWVTKCGPCLRASTAPPRGTLSLRGSLGGYPAPTPAPWDASQERLLQLHLLRSRGIWGPQRLVRCGGDGTGANNQPRQNWSPTCRVQGAVALGGESHQWRRAGSLTPALEWVSRSSGPSSLRARPP